MHVGRSGRTGDLQGCAHVRILAFLTDAFGGHGGIAQYNRHVLAAVCAMPEVKQVIAYPRLAAHPLGALPDKLDYRLASVGGKWRFLREAYGAARERVDLVLCGHINLLPAAAPLAYKLKTPLVLIAYGVEAWQPHRSGLVRHLVRRVDHVWAISRFTQDKLSAWSSTGSDRFEIMPPAVDLDQYGPGPRSPILIDRYRLAGRKVIMTLCRLDGRERYKGVDEVLMLMPRLIAQVPHLTFLIAGEGDDRRRLERKAADLDVNGHVAFTGLVAEHEKIDHYRLADAFVMPGWGEGFGIVYLEAMACGVPVLASRLDGSREAVRDGRIGRLVDPNNSDELESAILGVLNDPRGVPPGLAHFALPEFQQRVSAATRKVAAMAQGNANQKPSWIRAVATKGLLRDGAWVALGQAGAALGTLVGIRVLTEYLTVDVFGAVALVLGAATFAASLLVNPLMQGLLRFHADAIRQGRVDALRTAVTPMLANVAVCAGVLFVTAGLVQGLTSGAPIWLGLLVAGIFAVDAARSLEFTFLNAGRQHRAMALWAAGEAWSRLLAAVAVVVWWGGTVSSVLLGYLAASSVMLWTWYGFAREDTARPGRHPGVSLAEDFTQSLRAYAWPLVPLAVIAWISSLADRYVIGGLWGLKEVGLYAAAYGLVARPFLMLSAITELVARPVYYGAVAEADTARSERIIRTWLLLVTVCGGAGFMMFWLFKDVIAAWLLAEPYRKGAALLPWIAGGYWLLIISHVFERQCYAHRDTRAVLVIYAAGGIAALVVLYPAVSLFGMAGAAAAVPAYFGAQLLTAVSLNLRSRRYGSVASCGRVPAIPRDAT